MDLLNSRLQRLEYQRRAQRCLDAGARALTWSAGSGALLLLGLRLTGSTEAVAVVVIGSLLAPAVILPRCWARRDRPDQLAARLDRLAAGDGTIMALAALPPADRPLDWQARCEAPLRNLRWPTWSWAGLRIPALAVACLLVLAALPPPAPPTPPAQAPWLGAVEAAKERLAEDEPLFKAAEHQELVAQADRLAGLDASLGQAAWEAVERLERTIGDGEARAVERLAQVMAASDQAADGTTASLADLGTHLAALAQDAPGLAKLPQLDPATAAALAAALAGMPLDAAQRAALAAAGLLPAGTKAQPVDPAAIRRLAESLRSAVGSCPKPGRCSGEALAAALARCSSTKAGLCAIPGSGLGKGGVNRGPGHGTLALDREPTTSPLGQEASLSAVAPEPEPGTTIATLSHAPESLAAHAPATTATFAAQAADARRAPVAPRHRAAVGRYFTPAAPAPAPISLPPPTDSVIP